MNTGQTSGTADPEDWLIGALGGSCSAAGVRVNHQTGLTDSPLYQAITMISQDLARLPVNVYRDEITNDALIKDHPISKIWNLVGNDDMNPFEVRESIMGNALLHGNGVGAIHWQNSKPVGVFPFRPGSVWMERLPESKVMDDIGMSGQWIYRYHVENETSGWMFPHEVFHIKNYGEGRWGYSPLYMFKNLIGNGLALDLFQGAHFNNNAYPGGVLTKTQYGPGIPNQLGPEAIQNLRREWNAMQQGIENSSKIGILQDGMTFTPVGFSNTDSQLMDATKYHREQIASIYKIPPSKLGVLEAATYNNIQEMSRAYIQQTLKPWARRWEQESRKKLTSQRERTRNSVVVEIDFSELERPGWEERREYYIASRQWGWHSVNEIRRMEGLDGIGPQGDVYLTPSNMADSETREPFSIAPEPPQPQQTEQPQEEESEETEDDMMEAFVAFTREALHKAQQIECKSLHKGLERKKPFADFSVEFYGRFRETLMERIECVAGLPGFVGPAEVEKLADRYIEESLTAVQGCVDSETLRVAVSDFPRRVEPFVRLLQVKRHESARRI
jgi:HK97 family phage portal protein